MPKLIKYDQKAREAILRGVDTLADAVKVTLGPRGRNVIIEKTFGAPLITKDGVTVAKEIELEDKFENMGVQMVKEVASKTSDVAGDGTTTATVLAQAIYREGSKLVAAGINPMAMKRGIEKAVDAVVGTAPGGDQGGAIFFSHRWSEIRFIDQSFSVGKGQRIQLPNQGAVRIFFYFSFFFIDHSGNFRFISAFFQAF